MPRGGYWLSKKPSNIFFLRFTFRHVHKTPRARACMICSGPVTQSGKRADLFLRAFFFHVDPDSLQARQTTRCCFLSGFFIGPCTTPHLPWCIRVIYTSAHRVHIGIEMKQGECTYLPLSAGAYTLQLCTRWYILWKGVGVHPPPHPHQPGLIFPSWWNVWHKAAVATLCVLCAAASLISYIL